jgi:hypothetical protein
MHAKKMYNIDDNQKIAAYQKFHDKDSAAIAKFAPAVFLYRGGMDSINIFQSDVHCITII